MTRASHLLRYFFNTDAFFQKSIAAYSSHVRLALPLAKQRAHLRTSGMTAAPGGTRERMGNLDVCFDRLRRVIPTLIYFTVIYYD